MGKIDDCMGTADALSKRFDAMRARHDAEERWVEAASSEFAALTRQGYVLVESRKIDGNLMSLVRKK